MYIFGKTKNFSFFSLKIKKEEERGRNAARKIPFSSVLSVALWFDLYSAFQCTAGRNVMYGEL